MLHVCFNMQSLHNLEESLRETACLGDVDKIGVLVHAGVDVNSQNAMNGWTALHWGARRNHKSVVSYLLQSGADPNIRSFQNELAVDVTQCEEIRQLLLGENNKKPNGNYTTIPKCKSEFNILTSGGHLLLTLPFKKSVSAQKLCRSL